MRVHLAMLVILLGCVGLGFGALTAANTEEKNIPGEIRATRFIVVDDAGKKRAEFGVLDDGEAGMVVWNKEKSAAVSLSIDRLGMPRLVFENSKGDGLLDLGILGGRSPVLVMREEDGRRRLAMMVTPNGSVAIGLYDTQKRARCTLSLDPDAQPLIRLLDGEGKVRASLIVHDKGGAALDLFDRKGRQRVVVQVNAEGEPDAALFGPDGKALWSARGKK